jgi:nucleoside-diphosphate-sugar epimerase
MRRMNLLVVGGSGYVGSIRLPTLAQHHRLRIFDLRPLQRWLAKFSYAIGRR